MFCNVCVWVCVCVCVCVCVWTKECMLLTEGMYHPLLPYSAKDNIWCMFLEEYLLIVYSFLSYQVVTPQTEGILVFS